MPAFSISAKALKGVLLCALSLMCLPLFAEGGISIQGTRIIYPQNSKQESISVRNSSSTDSFLIQSWVEDATGKRSRDFVVTPPLYLSNPYNENTLRIMFAGSEGKSDRETLYYFISKAIPSIDNENQNGQKSDGASIRIAAATRIKLFVRPKGLNFLLDKAPSELKFRRAGRQLEISNPSPYYITLTDIKIGGKPLKGVMVSPKSNTMISLPENSGSTITFNAINDYGALTPPVTATIRS